MGRKRPGTGVEPLKSCIRVRFRWNGQPTALYLRPCQSTEDITPVAQLLLRDLYGDLLTPVNARRMIQPEA